MAEPVDDTAQMVAFEVEDILSDYGATTPDAIDRVADELQRGLPSYRSGIEFGELVIKELRARAARKRIRAI